MATLLLYKVLLILKKSMFVLLFVILSSIIRINIFEGGFFMKKKLCEMQKSSFFKTIGFVATIFAMSIVSASCKHDGGETEKLKPNTVAVTLSGIKVETAPIVISDVMNAGSTIKTEVDVEFTSDPTDATLQFTPNLKTYDATTKKGKWALNMEENSLKIAVAKDGNTKNYTLKIKRLALDEPLLESLKIDNEAIRPKEEPDIIVATETEKDKVKVEYTANNGSIVTTTPSIPSGTNWNLVYGENTLKFTVTKASKTRNYTLKITRKKVTPKITSITIGPHKKEREGIVEYETTDKKIIEIPVPTYLDGVEFDVDVETNVDGVQVEWNPPLERGKVKFGNIQFIQDLKKEFSIKVSKDGDVNEYKVKVLMMTNAAGFHAARYLGKSSNADLETIKKILRHEKNINLELVGANATVIFITQTEEWQTLLCNNENAEVTPSQANFKSELRKALPLTTDGQAIPVKVIISNSEWENGKPKQPWLATEEFEFTITCNSKADAFIKNIFVNDRNITDESKDAKAFTRLFASEPNIAEINSGEKAIIAIDFSKKVAKVKINTYEILEDALEEVKDGSNIVGYRAKLENIVVKDDGTPTPITIVVSPKAEDVNYRETTMKFNLNYKIPPRLFPESYRINEVEYQDILPLFDEALRNKDNPLYTVKTNRLAMHFVFSQAPKKVTMDIADTSYEVTADKIIKGKDEYNNDVYKVNIDGIIDASKKQVKLTFDPADEGAFSKGEWKFEIKGSNTKPKITPKFEALANDENLTEDFLSKLESGTATYEVAGNSANLTIYLSEYEHDFLLEQIKINNVKVTGEEFKREQFNDKIVWMLKKNIEGLKTDWKPVEIKFIGKTGIAEELIWTFKLKSGGSKPKIPKKYIAMVVANYGGDNLPFPEEFLKGLEKGDGSPMLELYGKDVEVSFSTLDDQYLKEVKFKIDDGEEKTEEANFASQAEYTFKNVSKAPQEHTITAMVVPNSQDYSPLVYKFKIKILDDLKMPTPYRFFLNREAKPNGYKVTLDKDVTTIAFQSAHNVMQEVRIGKGATLQASDKVDIKEQKDEDGQPFYVALKDIELSTSDFEDWIIEVKPQNTSKFATVRWAYKLKGKATDDNDPSFVISNGEPKIIATPTFKDGIGQDRDILDYGVTKIDFTVYTMSKESTVKATRVDWLTGADIAGEAEISLVRDAGTRKLTGSITSFENKPTMIKLWCVAKDGVTKDPIYGQYKLKINPVGLFWNYNEISQADDGYAAYKEIKLSKKMIKKNTVHMIFAPWKEEYGYKVDLDAVCDGQSKFEKISELNDYQDQFRTSLDITGMKNGDEKEIKFRLVHTATNTEALVYKVKVRMGN